MSDKRQAGRWLAEQLEKCWRRDPLPGQTKSQENGVGRRDSRGGGVGGGTRSAAAEVAVARGGGAAAATVTMEFAVDCGVATAPHQPPVGERRGGTRRRRGCWTQPRPWWGMPALLGAGSGSAVCSAVPPPSVPLLPPLPLPGRLHCDSSCNYVVSVWAEEPDPMGQNAACLFVLRGGPTPLHSSSGPKCCLFACVGPQLLFSVYLLFSYYY